MKSFSGKTLPRPSGPCSSLENSGCSGAAASVSRPFLGQLPGTLKFSCGSCKSWTPPSSFPALRSTRIGITSVQILHTWTQRKGAGKVGGCPWEPRVQGKARTSHFSKHARWPQFPITFPTLWMSHRRAGSPVLSQRPPVMAMTGVHISLVVWSWAQFVFSAWQLCKTRFSRNKS